MKITMDHQVNAMMMMDTEMNSETADGGVVRSISKLAYRHSDISHMSSKIRDARANAAARKIEFLAQQEQSKREEELDEIQNVLNRKKREMEQHRLNMLLRVEETKLKLYEDSQKRGNMRRGMIGSGSQLYSSMNKKQEMHVSTPLHMINPDREAVCSKMSKIETESMSSMIVPVWVSSKKNPNKEDLVYALLDTQSDTTFILEKTADKLNARPEVTRLSTLSVRDSTIQCKKFTDLRVRGYSTNVYVDLQTTYSMNFIPTDRSHIPTNVTAEKWSHLRQISHQIPPMQDCEVGLLIGYNCPMALAPRNCVTGEGNKPFAVQTDLGWSIVGGLDHQEDVETIRSSCRSIVTEIKEMKPCTRQHAHRKEARCIAMPNDSEVKYENVHTIKMQEEVALPQCVEHFSRCHRAVGRIVILQQPMETRRNPDEVNANSLSARETATLPKKIQSVPFMEEFAPGLADGPKKDRCTSQDDMSFLKKDDSINQENDERCSARLPFKMKPSQRRNGNSELRRYRHRKRRFKQDEMYDRDYRKFADEILKHGDAAKIPPDKLQNNYTGFDSKRNRRRCDLIDPGGTEEIVQIIY